MTLIKIGELHKINSKLFKVSKRGPLGPLFFQLFIKQISNNRIIKNYEVCLNGPMNKSFEKKLSTGNSGVNLKKTENIKPTWHFEVEGSGQRKRYLRSLKDKKLAQFKAI